ncbi:hypothetical protein AGMMS49942_20090 [Spirochaetia bacterium]|nr:hypothetical protein AGMMS49942_20090 [Spirochaetia bacterium]
MQYRRRTGKALFRLRPEQLFFTQFILVPCEFPKGPDANSDINSVTGGETLGHTNY